MFDDDTLRIMGISHHSEIPWLTGLGSMGFVPHIVADILSRSGILLPETRVLDLGCGVGAGALFFARNGSRYTVAVDISVDLLSEARSRLTSAGLIENVGFVCADLRRSIPVSKDWPDLIVASAIGDLLGTVDQFLTNLSRDGFHGSVIWLETIGRRAPLDAARDSLRAEMDRDIVQRDDWTVVRQAVEPANSPHAVTRAALLASNMD